MARTKQSTDLASRVAAEIADDVARLRQLSDPQLINAFDDLREQVFSNDRDMAHIATQTLAFSKEAIYRGLGMDLYDVQVLAGRTLIDGKIAEMHTGEGKTISAVPGAVYGGVLGRGCHVATTSDYLARRDFEQLRSVYQALGLTVGYLCTEDDAEMSKSEAYACDVTYGPGYEFGFDYLRDQMMLKDAATRPAGQRMIDQLAGNPIEPPCQIRGLGFAVVDEADNVMIDDASSPQVLSEFQPGEAPDSDAVRAAMQVADLMEPDRHYIEPTPEQLKLTSEGVQMIHAPSVTIPFAQLIRPWSRYVESALKAKLHFLRDVQYVVVDDEVRIVEQSTGRIFEDRSWQAGLHQAVEAKEGLPITPESLPLAQITRQRFYGLYENLSGMTGTAAACRKEFHAVYGLDIVQIPLRVPSGRKIMPMRAFSGQDQKWEAIAQSVRAIHQRQRPVLIGTRTIAESEILATLLQDAGIPFELLNGKQDADEAGVVSRAGHQAAVTIATNLAGRGTDIKMTREVKAMGGLHVIVSECHSSSRVDRQLVGRCGRQGDPGSCQTFIAADDWLMRTHAPWLVEGIERLTRNGEANMDLEPRIRKLQQQIETRQFSARMQLLQDSHRRNEILTAMRG